MIKRNAMAALAAAFLLGLASQPTRAAPFHEISNAPGGGGPQALFLSDDLWRTVRVNYGGTIEFLAAGAFGVRLEETLADGTKLGLPVQDLPAFCFEIAQQISLPALYESVPLAAAMPAPRAAAVSRLWGHRQSVVIDAANPEYDGVTGALPRDRIAAFQVAIWDLVIDGGDGYGTGTFRLVSPDAPLLGLALRYLAQAGDASLPPGDVVALVSATSQDLLDDPPDTVVPAPASALLLAGALAALRRARRPQAR
ncbi:MAG: hypothetical protein ACKOUS_04435 [Alphaproteobacteria bacterium]